MKKLLCLLLLLPAMLLAAPVDPNLAQQVAENFINAPESGTNSAMRKAPRKPKRMARAAKQVTNDQQFYVFNSEDGEGFVIVAADDAVRPILGYSNNTSFDTENIPYGVLFFLDSYSQQIKYVQENNIVQSEEVKQKWEALKNNTKLLTATTVVAPLITTKWDQAPLYNNLCPIVSKKIKSGIFTDTYYREQAVTGCGATALAQVMNYWEWPQIGNSSNQYKTNLAGTLYCNFGATEYDWGNMPDSLTPNSNSAQIKAVATLMYHCGVAMNMNYGFIADGGSGIDTILQVENAVKKYFRYSEATTSIDKSQYTDAQWIATLKAQLDAHQPMVYIGIGNGGHAFVCDGYNSDNYFHFNWGWSGGSDGFYPIDSLMPGTNGIGSGGHDYTAKQFALINMVPKVQPQNIANLQLESQMSLDKNSIEYRGTTAIYATVKNSGTNDFTGDISALVIDTAGHFVTEIPIKTNFTLPKNTTLLIAKSIVQNLLLVPGRYAISLVYNSNDTGYQLVGSEFYNNGAILDVSLTAPIEKKSDFEIYSDCNNELTTGHQIWFRVTFGNTSSSPFTGRIALALYDPETLQLAQLVSEISFALTGIGANEERTVNFIDTIRLEPKSYLAALVYSNDGQTYNFVGSTYSQNPCMVRVISDPAKVEDDAEPTEEFKLKPGKYVIVASRNKTGDKNWYYMTSDLGTASTKRFQAVSTGTENMDAIALTDLEDKYVWTLEADGTNWKLKNGTQYVTWTSGNSANLGATAKSLTFEVADNQVQAHFNDGTAERYLSLNATTNNNYFAFYANTNQITNLFFLPYDDGSTPPPPARDCKSVPYTETFASSQGDFSVDNLTLPDGFTSIWNWDSQYGMVAKCIKGSTKYESESWLISPCVELPENETCVLSFSHAAKFFQSTSQMSLWISTDYDESDPEAAQWNRLIIPTYPTGSNWNWYESGDIDLSEYKGQYINIAFRYTSTSSYAPQWEIKNFAIRKQSTTGIDGIYSNKPSAIKILRNGQIYILRGDKTYTLQGQEVK